MIQKTGHFLLRSRNLFGEQAAQFVELLPLSRVHRCEFRRLGGDVGPSGNAFDRAPLKADFRVVQVAGNAVDSGPANGIGGNELQSHRQGDRLVQKL